MFAQLFKSAISNFNTVVKTMDSKLDAFVLSVAKQLDVENEKVKVAVLEAFKLLEDDGQRRLEQEKLEKQQKQEQLKKEREEKKAKEEAEKAERAAKRAEEARIRAEKKAAEEAEKAKKAAEKEAEKAKKAEEKAKKEAEKLAEKVEVVCQHEGCGKKIKKGKDFDGITVCADCHKKLEKAKKEAEKVICIHISKDDKKCSSAAVDGTYCKRHQKKEKPEKESKKSKKEQDDSSSDEEDEKVVKKQPKQEEKTKAYIINDFDFSNEEVVEYDPENDYWKANSVVNVKGTQAFINKNCGIVFDSSATLVGVYAKDVKKILAEKTLDIEIKQWAKEAGFIVPSLEEEEPSEVDLVD